MNNDHGPHSPAPAGRDPVIDLVRAGCLIIVVALHAFMAGISVDGGRLAVFDATHGQSWFAVLTWLVQIMPLFFLAGGFASLTHWRRLRARGATPAAYVHARLVRLARPAVITFGTIAAGFGLASLLGVPGELLAQVGFRMGQPMWFLGVYLGVTALVPIMVRLHENAPRRTLSALAAGAVLIDLVRSATGLEAIGFLNLGFVWLAVQQLGFGYADGWFHRIDRRRLPAAVLLGVAAMIMIGWVGGYSPNLIDNLNPPTCLLLVLGVVQALALTLAEPVLRRLCARPVVATAADAINGRALTIYLWHMAVLVCVALVGLAAGLPFPDPLSPGWWVTRGYWLAAIALVMIIAARLLGRFEHAARPRAEHSARSTVQVLGAVLVAIAAVAAVLVAGFSVLSATAAALGLAGSLRLVGGPVRRPSMPAVGQPVSVPA